MRRMALVMMLLFLLVSNAAADELIFSDDDQYLTKLDFQLEIFDLKFNYLGVYAKHPFIHSINSVGFYKKILSYVYLNDSIAEIPKNKRKQILRDICEQLFRLYKDNFTMTYEEEWKELKAGRRKSADGHRMKPPHLEIHIHQIGDWKTIGTWYGGYLELKGE